MKPKHAVWMCLACLLAAMQAGMHARADEAPRTAVAKVNGQVISHALFDGLIKARAGVPNPYHEETREEIEERNKALQQLDRAEVLENLIVMEALAQRALEKGLHLQPDIAAEAELQYKTLLQQHLVNDFIRGITVQPDEIAARYAELAPEKEYRVRHILLRNEDAARAVIAELDRGKRFEDLARKHSIDRQSRKDGRLGWLMLNQMTEPFADATAALKPGLHSPQPVRTTYGWHVIRVDGTRDLPKPSLDDMRTIFRTRILQEKVEEKVRQVLQESRIEILSPDSAKTD